ncbi:MAG: tetratricopeptide repeat protein [Candidatus Kapaibacteriales bacterium]
MLERDSNAAVLNALGNSYKRIKRWELAADAYASSIVLDPEYVQPMESLAELLLIQNKREEAQEIMEKAVDIEPTQERRYMMAQVYEYNNKKKARDLYKEIYEEDKNNKTALGKYISLTKEIGSIEEFIELLKETFEDEPGNEVYAGDILEELYLDKRYSEGIDLIFKAKKNMPYEAALNLYMTFGDNIYRDQRDSTDEAEKVMLQAIENDDFNSWRIQYLGGLLASKIGDTARTEEYFSEVLMTADTIPDLATQVGIFFMNRNKLNRALDIFSLYSTKYPKDARFPFFEGVIYNQMDSLDKAEKKLLISYRLDTNNVDVLSNLGLIYDKRGIPEKTETFYQKAYAMQPDNPLLNNNYAYHLSNYGGDLERAERMARYALSIDKDNPSYLDTYAWIQYRLGKYEIALEYLNKALAVDDTSAELYEHLGDVYIELGRKKDAKKAYQQAQLLDPTRIGLPAKLMQIN